MSTTSEAGPPGSGTPAEPGAPTDAQARPADDPAAADAHAYLAQVMAEIDQEVRHRRTSGDLPARVERELDELFLQYSPVAGRAGSVAEALRLVDASAYVDPVAPVESTKSGGAAVKKGLRQVSLWYVTWVTDQVNQFAASVSRALHGLEEQLRQLEHEVEGQRVPAAPVLDVPWAQRTDAWWVADVTAAVKGAPGRVLHAASGDGWLVRALVDVGVDAYGTDPRPGRADAAAAGGLDCRDEGLIEHLRATGPAALGAVVVSGLVEGMGAGQRDQLLELAADRLAPGGLLLLHSVAPAAWADEDLGPEADLAPGRPLRPATWVYLLDARGYEVSHSIAPDGRDYLVSAVVGDGAAAR